MTATPEIIAPYKPLPWQITPWRDKSFLLLLTGSAGGGKSRLAGEKIHAFMKKYPGAMGVMVRKTRESMTNSTVLFMERTVIGKDPQVTHFSSKNRFEYANGSILAYGGMKNEEQREQIRSIGAEGGLDIAWMEEANKFSEADFNELIARMRGKAAGWSQIIPSTNPDVPHHWIYQRLIKGGEASVYYSGARDNPHNPPQYLKNLELLTGVQYERLVEGKWVQAEGAVYSDYDPAVHLIDAFDIPPDWRRIRVVDFGYTNPFVCQWWAIDPDGRLYLYREIYWSGRIVSDHAEQILALSEGETIEATICDHDAEDRATLESCGIYTQLAVKDVSPGIQRTQARLRVQADGKPRLFIMRGALVAEDPDLRARMVPTSTIEEIVSYVWTEMVEGKEVKEVPVKMNDHGMDAMRYGVMYLDHGLPSGADLISFIDLS